MNNPDSSGLIYGLNDKPRMSASLAAALQHVLASFVGIITPTLVICAALNLEAETSYLISMALLASGIGTFIQVKRFGPIGSGLIAIQGTSFAFLASLLAAGFFVREKGGSDQEVMAMLIGICFWGAFVEIILSQFIQKLQRVITPLVTGIVILTIGLSLIKVGATDLAGGYGADSFGATSNLLIGGGVLLLIIVLNASSNSWLCFSSIVIGMLVGSVAAYFMGLVSFTGFNDISLISIPQPFKYGFAFDWQVFLSVAIIYLLTTIETSGDLTINSSFCGLPISGSEYLKRIRGGVLGDGVNSLIAAALNTFPNTTFSQNNAVIQLTGVASRHVGFYVSGLLVIFGLCPIFGVILQNIPKPVLGGATLIMFGMIAAGGIRILANEELDRRKILIIGSSLGIGLSVMMVPDALQNIPNFASNIIGSPVSAAGVTAIVLSLFLADTNSHKNHANG